MLPGRRRSGSFLTERARTGPNREFGAARQTDAKLQRQRQATTPQLGVALIEQGWRTETRIITSGSPHRDDARSGGLDCPIGPI